MPAPAAHTVSRFFMLKSWDTAYCAGAGIVIPAHKMLLFAGSMFGGRVTVNMRALVHLRTRCSVAAFHHGGYREPGTFVRAIERLHIRHFNVVPRLQIVDINRDPLYLSLP